MISRDTILMGLEGLRVHKLRSILTMLGIIFGVGAVIAMLSIGEGAKREALEKYKALGVDNIIIRDKSLSDAELEEVRAKFSRGLSLQDADAIEKIVPTVAGISPQAEMQLEAKYEDKTAKVTLVGITPAFQQILDYRVDTGEFLAQDHHERALRVAVIGADVVKSLFPVKNPLGEKIKLDDQWFEVIGTVGTKSLFTETVGELAARNLNQDVYIPLSSFLRRFTPKNPLASEINQLTVKISDSKELLESAAVIKRIIDRRHHQNTDYDLVIPYELLKQEEKERRIYNMVLGSIAAISLLVGGIGIMNIMLATVLERTREIGIRRAIGATRKEILAQFLIESIGLSILGGVIGIMLGISMSLFINTIAEFKTVITFASIFVAFVVSAAVGIAFGTFPAKKAAALDPIESLRYE
jgi:putative ABC transport system permease protein